MIMTMLFSVKKKIQIIWQVVLNPPGLRNTCKNYLSMTRDG
ncbi:hypothetical protein SAMN02910406_00555 [Ruminococcus albus]|uniref:Uncharacterized protein n=1 Tax=Ruminococcus albus TaxID=1264 RepID=A0A1I1DWW7_RUMAL|nr:hypothetical protein SAMN02910406_00555 [Ruminococcus albus]